MFKSSVTQYFIMNWEHAAIYYNIIRVIALGQLIGNYTFRARGNSQILHQSYNLRIQAGLSHAGDLMFDFKV